MPPGGGDPGARGHLNPSRRPAPGRRETLKPLPQLISRRRRCHRRRREAERAPWPSSAAPRPSWHTARGTSPPAPRSDRGAQELIRENSMVARLLRSSSAGASLPLTTSLARRARQPRFTVARRWAPGSRIPSRHVHRRPRRRAATPSGDLSHPCLESCAHAAPGACARPERRPLERRRARDR
jgi:hypothetical protein